ncbi:DUF4373 domain-containing protein [Listeria monocytogenes]|nr:DUF4373 domain-containing protein [Listeria monocytogenes]
MARPTKDGLDYFPLDVDFFENEKIEAISGEFGLKGEAIAIRLLCAIYDKGYFIVWNDLLKMKLLKRIPGTSKELLDQVINRLVKWGLFNEDLFNSDMVLTSKAIQEVYLEATKRRKKQKPTLYWINDDSNPSSKGVNVYINPQSKVKESKVNKSKVNSNENPPSAPDKIFQVYEDCYGIINGTITESLLTWINDLSDELVIEAIQRSYKQGKNFRYAEGIMRKWASKKYTTMDQVKAEDIRHEQNNKPAYQRSGRKEVLPEGFEKWPEATTEKTTPKMTPEQKAQFEKIMAERKKDHVSSGKQT